MQTERSEFFVVKSWLSCKWSKVTAYSRQLRVWSRNFFAQGNVAVGNSPSKQAPIPPLCCSLCTLQIRRKMDPDPLRNHHKPLGTKIIMEKGVPSGACVISVLKVRCFCGTQMITRYHILWQDIGRRPDRSRSFSVFQYICSTSVGHRIPARSSTFILDAIRRLWSEIVT